MAAKPDLNATQLVASGLATVTASVGASYLGVAGTIGGAAFMSVASTAGVAVYKHYLDQGKEQIWTRGHERVEPGEGADGEREPVGETAEEVTRADPTRTVSWPPGRRPASDPSEAMTRAERAGRGADPASTRLDPMAGDPNETRIDRPGRSADPTETRMDQIGDEVTRMLGQGRAGPAREPAAEPAREPAGPEVGRPSPWQGTFDWMKKRWFVLAGTSAAVFAVVMGGITLIEAISDKPVSAMVGVSNTKGTTFGNVGGGGGTAEPSDQRPTHEEPTGPATGQPSGTTTEEPGDGQRTGQPEGSGSPTAPDTSEPSTQEPTTQPTGPSGSGDQNNAPQQNQQGGGARQDGGETGTG